MSQVLPKMGQLEKVTPVVNGVPFVSAFANGNVTWQYPVAVSTNTANGIVRRDAIGGFSAGTIVATFSGSGGLVTNLNAASLATNLVPTARLGTGTANATTFLRGDNAWVPPPAGNPAGADTQVQFNDAGAFNGISGLTINKTTGTLTATHLNGEGSAITGLNAANLASNLVPTTRLGTGTANGTTFLRGDGIWIAPPSTAANPGGIDTQIQFNDVGTFNGVSGLTFNKTTNTLTATNVAGSGTGLTALNAANLATNLVPMARLDATSAATANKLALRTANGNFSTARFRIVETVAELRTAITDLGQGHGYVSADNTVCGGIVYLTAGSFDLGSTPLNVPSGIVLEAVALSPTYIFYNGAAGTFAIKLTNALGTGLHTNSCLRNLIIKSERGGICCDDRGGGATVTLMADVILDNVAFNCAEKCIDWAGSAPKYHCTLNYVTFPGHGDMALDSNVNMLLMIGCELINNARSNVALTVPLWRLVSDAECHHCWLEDKFNTQPLMDHSGGSLKWFGGHIEPHGPDNNPRNSVKLHDGSFATFDQTWFVEVGSQWSITVNSFLNILTYHVPTAPAPSGAPLAQTDWLTVMTIDGTSDVIYRGVSITSYTLQATMADFTAAGYIRSRLAATSYTQFQHFNAASLPAFPRGLFTIFGASETNVGNYFAPGNATGATQLPMFLGISTNASPTQAASKQLLFYADTTRATICTQNHEMNGGGASLPINIGGSAIDGSDAPLTIAANGTIALKGATTVTTGGLTVTAGGATITAGGLTIIAGGANINGDTLANGLFKAAYQASPDTYGLIVGTDGALNSRVYTGGSFAGRIQTNATGLGFFGATPIAKPTITGSRGANAALADLLTKLALLGLVTDSTS